MDQFVCVRLTRAETLDLSLFQFDPDLSFAVFFLNSDRTIYGRYGSRSDFYQSDREVSLEGLQKAMQTALHWHQNLDAVKPSLAGKRGPHPQYRTLAEFPKARSSGYSRALQGSGNRCTHCHDIRTAEQMAFRTSDLPIPDRVLFSWPMPDVIGLHLDPKQIATVESVAKGSPAQADGFQVGDRIVAVQGQPILSIADVQWVLQNAEDEDSLLAEVDRNGETLQLAITLARGWRRTFDISWRITTGELRRRILGGITYRRLSSSDRQELGLEDNVMALKAARGVSRSTGLIRRGDVVVAVDGDRSLRTEADLIAYFMQKKRPGQQAEFTLIRSSSTLSVNVPVKQ